MKSLLPIQIRELQEGDHNFVYGTQTQDLYMFAPYKHCKWRTFKTNHVQTIQQLMTISQTLVACLTEDPDTILGYLMWTPFQGNLIIHYCHVKTNFRHQDILHDLLEATRYQYQLIICTQWHEMIPIFQRQHHNIAYDPYLINTLLQLREHHDQN